MSGQYYWRPTRQFEAYGVLIAAGIAWLVGKYKQYVLLRERVLGESRSLRTKLEASKQEGKKVAYGASPFAGAPRLSCLRLLLFYCA